MWIAKPRIESQVKLITRIWHKATHTSSQKIYTVNKFSKDQPVTNFQVHILKQERP